LIPAAAPFIDELLAVATTAVADTMGGINFEISYGGGERERVRQKVRVRRAL
jgi:hypothetical protein